MGCQPTETNHSRILLGYSKVSENGNLVLMNAQMEILWSTNVSNITSNTIAQLLNTGTLVLQETTTRRMVWQSFQDPTNTFLQKMKLSTNNIGGEKVKLASWKSPEDPSIGDLSLCLERLNIPEVFTWRGTQPYWRSGPWNGRIFLGIPYMNTDYLDGFYLGGTDEENDTYYLTYTYANKLRMYASSVYGKLCEFNWDYAKRYWFIKWSALESECHVYGKCGAFGSCDPTSSPICSCLRGFDPRNAEEWNRQNWRNRCVRRKYIKS